MASPPKKNEGKASRAESRRRPGRPVDRAKIAGILAAALQLFLERGYAAPSMDLVARQAGVSKITIYAHFSSKEALFGAIIHEMAGRLTGAIEKLRFEGLPPEQALTEVGRAYLRLALAPRALALHRLVVAEAGRVPGLGRLIHQSGPRPIVLTLADYLKTRSELVIEQPDRAAEHFLGMVLGHRQLGLLLGALPPARTRAGIDEQVAYAVRLFLAGCRG